MLVPEIALTPQLAGRFRARFGDQVALLHSGLSDAERHAEWLRLRRGEARICVGVRSAIFAPVEELAVIVVDEEHEPSFKQEDGPPYHARDLAVVRGKFEDAVVLLGSATPSLETLENARRGRYRLLSLPVRVDDRPMPRVELVDLTGRPRARRGEPPALLSAELQAALGETLAAGQQSILFLNRRGYQTLVLCESCGAEARCPDCSVALTHHARRGLLLCHYCGRSEPVGGRCGACDGVRFGLGFGTEQVEEAARRLLPGARVGRLDRDAVSGAGDTAAVLARFARRELDVLVGTQMVTKGHDFPGVTLVGVVLADTSLGAPRLPRRRADLPAPGAGGRAGRARRRRRPGADPDLQPGHPGGGPLGAARLPRLRRGGAGAAPGALLPALRPAHGGPRRGLGGRGPPHRRGAGRGGQARAGARDGADRPGPGRHRADPRQEPLAPALPGPGPPRLVGAAFMRRVSENLEQGAAERVSAFARDLVQATRT